MNINDIFKLGNKKMEATAKEKIDNIWIRGAYILLFGFIYSAAEMVMILVVVVQFMSIVVNKEKNEKVLSFGADLSIFLYQVFRFLTFNTDTRPFPFADWPKGKVGE